MDPRLIAAPLVGGLLIGLAVAVLLLGVGRVAGISGIFGGLVGARGDALAFRWLFVAGLLAGAIVFRLVSPAAFAETPAVTPTLLVSGGLVGVGTRLAGGCTSGHGVCGNSRLSLRSMVATGTFIGVAAVVVFMVRHVAGQP